LQITHACQQWWAHNEHSCVIVDHYEDIAEYKNQAEWLIIQTAGDVIIEQHHLWNKLTTIPDDVGYVGHLVWYDDKETPSIEPQCFILRTAAVDYIDFSSQQKDGRQFSRSIEDVHQGASPLYIELLSTNKLQHYEFGSCILDQVLQRGYKVQHFDQDWRFTNPSWDINDDTVIDNFLKKYNWSGLPSRGYCFPYNTTEEFSEALAYLDVYENLDDAQQLLISIIKGIIQLQHSDTVNVLHWDGIPELGPAKHIISPANGLLAECLAYKTGATQITFYDINHINIDFKKYLYMHWNGKDYIEFANEWAATRNLITEPKCVKGQQLSKRDLDIIEQISLNWDYYKNLNVEFIHLDLAAAPNTVIDKISDNSVLHTSTILSYYIITHILHCQDTINHIRETIAEKITLTNSVWIET
jgi:hypothetical protein